MAPPLTLTTPLPPGTLLPTGFSGTEAISQLFAYDLDLVAENAQSVPFDQLVGQQVRLAVAMPAGGTRFFNGLVSRFSQGRRGSTFTAFRMEVVPQVWMLTRKAQSRIFQSKSVPDVLRAVLGTQGMTYQLKQTYQPREYCVQYRESDFDFASRLMEEEGIFYYFRHTSAGHQMVVADQPATFSSVAAPSTETFGDAPSTPDTGTVFDWEKFQELRSGRVTLWDHNFELPHETLEGDAVTQDAVRMGTVTHHLELGNDGLELYDFPGGYAKRFDGISPGGSEVPSRLSLIQPDAARTAGIRMQQEAVNGLVARGQSNCRQFVPGATFGLQGHFDANGKYLLTSVHHRCEVAGDPRTATQAKVAYHNDFACIPTGLPFRPQRTTPIPTVRGSQSAVVVGPAGEQEFTDKYGRVKVQFHWDRQGKNDANSSCWVRVAALHAGQETGYQVAPRIGQEVIVDFLEGDPDQPIIIGSVYNPDRMPPLGGSG